MPIGWDHPDTARYYEAFCRRHPRYVEANAALVSAARIERGMRVLDLAAGTGRTADAAVGCTGGITCVEPAIAMREVGRARLPQVLWVGSWPDGEVFDRILCGAAIWQMLPLVETFRRAASTLKRGGALVFNIPSLYVGEPDPPGGGRDPHLYELAARLANGRTLAAPTGEPLPAIDELLCAAGFTAHPWCARQRLTQAALRDWMKIPPMTDVLLDGMSADDRANCVEQAFAQCDPDSWRWETWSGWTAWKL